MARKKEKEKKKNVKYRFQKLFSLSIVFSEPWSIDIFRTSYNFISWNSLGMVLSFGPINGQKIAPHPWKKRCGFAHSGLQVVPFFFFHSFKIPCNLLILVSLHFNERPFHRWFFFSLNPAKIKTKAKKCETKSGVNKKRKSERSRRLPLNFH